MFNFISRREKHTEKIQNLLESDIPSIELRLYSSEVISLQRQNPDVIITPALNLQRSGQYWIQIVQMLK